MTQEQKERLRAIVEKGARKMTAEDRAFVRELAKTYNVNIPNNRCRDCIVDAAFELLRLDQEEDKGAEAKKKTDRRFVLWPGVDVYFGDVRVNAETLTDELAERIIARGFEKKFFAKC